jgi:hypothetical protein
MGGANAFERLSISQCVYSATTGNRRKGIGQVESKQQPSRRLRSAVDDSSGVVTPVASLLL